MPDPLVPFDRIPEDLTRVYADAALQVDIAVRQALGRGALGTAAYRERQLNLVNAILANLRRQTPPRARTAAAAAYGAGTVAVDRGFPGARLGGRFNGVHQRAVAAIASNMEGSLNAAVTGLGNSVAHVFEIANGLEGALPGARGQLGTFLGRRVDDRARAAALQTIAEHIATGSTRRDASKALKARLTNLAQRPMDDALQMIRSELGGEARAAFIDAAGRRWDLDVYTRMVARTTTREAATRGTVERLIEHGEDLVTISDHGTTTPLCQHYEGKTFSLSGKTAGYPRLDRLTPFHPGCKHYVRPAGDRFEQFERDLGLGAFQPPAPEPAPAPIKPVLKLTPKRAEALKIWSELPEGERTYRAVAEQMGITEGRARVYVREARHALEGTKPRSRRPGDTLKLIDPGRPPAPPFSPNAVPNPTTAAELEDQRIAYLINGDPGPEEGAHAAWEDAVVLEDRNEQEALDVVLGPFMAKFTKRAWAQHRGVRERFLSGEIDIHEVDRLCEDEWNRAEQAKLMREAKAQELRTTAIPCFICGRFKRRAADRCDWCGDDPVPLGISVQDFNRGYGYSS